MSTFIEILRQHLTEFKQTYQQQLTPEISSAINAMLYCQSGRYGTSKWHCDSCNHQELQPLSCGHRSCPQCQHHTTCDWLTRQQAKLLPVEYFMVTFTLPYELRALARQQPKLIYQAMFAVAASVLKGFGNTSKRIQVLLLNTTQLRSEQSCDTGKHKAIRVCPCCQQIMHCVGIVRTRTTN